MTDWLEIARRELSPSRGEVSEVFTVNESRDPEKSGPPLTSENQSSVAGWRDINGEPPIAKGTAEQGVSDVFAVGAPKGLGVASGRESVGWTSTPPSGFQIFDDPPDEALRKPSKPIAEEGCLRDDEVLEGELRKPSKPLWRSEQPSPDSSTAARWRRRFEDESIVVQRARDMPPEQAKAEALRRVFE